MTTVITRRAAEAAPTPRVVAIPDYVQAEIDKGALFVINHSGGKDSQAMLIMLRRMIPREQLLVIHADLPGEEWDGTWEHVQETSLGLPTLKVEGVETLEARARRKRKFSNPQYRECTSNKGAWDRASRPQPLYGAIYDGEENTIYAPGPGSDGVFLTWKGDANVLDDAAKHPQGVRIVRWVRLPKGLREVALPTVRETPL